MGTKDYQILQLKDTCLQDVLCIKLQKSFSMLILIYMGIYFFKLSA